MILESVSRSRGAIKNIISSPVRARAARPLSHATTRRKKYTVRSRGARGDKVERRGSGKLAGTGIEDISGFLNTCASLCRRKEEEEREGEGGKQAEPSAHLWSFRYSQCIITSSVEFRPVRLCGSSTTLSFLFLSSVHPRGRGRGCARYFPTFPRGSSDSPSIVRFRFIYILNRVVHYVAARPKSGHWGMAKRNFLGAFSVSDAPCF